MDFWRWKNLLKTCPEILFNTKLPNKQKTVFFYLFVLICRLFLLSLAWGGGVNGRQGTPCPPVPMYDFFTCSSQYCTIVTRLPVSREVDDVVDAAGGDVGQPDHFVGCENAVI